MFNKRIVLEDRNVNKAINANFYVVLFWEDDTWVKCIYYRHANEFCSNRATTRLRCKVSHFLCMDMWSVLFISWFDKGERFLKKKIFFNLSNEWIILIFNFKKLSHFCWFHMGNIVFRIVHRFHRCIQLTNTRHFPLPAILMRISMLKFFPFANEFLSQIFLEWNPEFSWSDWGWLNFRLWCELTNSLKNYGKLETLLYLSSCNHQGCLLRATWNPTVSHIWELCFIIPITAIPVRIWISLCSQLSTAYHHLYLGGSLLNVNFTLTFLLLISYIMELILSQLINVIKSENFDNFSKSSFV